MCIANLETFLVLAKKNCIIFTMHSCNCYDVNRLNAIFFFRVFSICTFLCAYMITVFREPLALEHSFDSVKKLLT